VITALPSLHVSVGRPKALLATYSVPTQLATLIKVMINVWKPKIKTESMRGGNRQATTVHMILSTVSVFLKWGETETKSLPAPPAASTVVACDCAALIMLLLVIFS